MDVVRTLTRSRSPSLDAIQMFLPVVAILGMIGLSYVSPVKVDELLQMKAQQRSVQSHRLRASTL